MPPRFFCRIITKEIRKTQRQIEDRARLLQRYKREANPSSVKHRKPGVTNSRRTETQIPETKFSAIKGEIFTSEYSSAMFPKPAIEERQHNSEPTPAISAINPAYPRCVQSGRLNEFYHSTVSACTIRRLEPVQIGLCAPTGRPELQRQ